MKKVWKKVKWEKILMKKIKYKIFSGFSKWSSFISRAWTEKCMVLFWEI